MKTNDAERQGPATDPLGYVVHLSDVRATRVDSVGGKGARLAEMLRAGLPVPSGFCITCSTFREFLRTTGLLDVISGMLEKDPADFSAVRATVVSTPMPEKLAREILTAYEADDRPRVAVRSSAPAEDAVSQSFAGQYDTFLDIHGDEALLDAVKQCWASLWSERAQAYRDERGERAAQAVDAYEMAVVVQTMVQADCAGVLFTVDPVGARTDRMVVEACWGLGEGLVSGRVTSDSFVLDRPALRIRDRQIRYKLTMCVPVAPGRVGAVKVPAERREVPTLTDGQVEALGRLGMRLREAEGQEQDIEWAIRDGVLYVLQSRPVTASGHVRAHRSPYFVDQPRGIVEGTLWSRMDLGELFTGLMTPLGRSFVKHYLFNAHDDTGRALGMRDRGEVGPSLGFLQGHVYVNVSYTTYYLGQSPPTRDQNTFTKRFTSEEVDLSAYANPFGHYPGGWKYLVTSAHWMRHFAKEMTTMQRRCARMVRSRYKEFDRFSSIRLPTLTHEELHREFQRALNYFYRTHEGYIPFYFNAFGFYGGITELCTTWFGDAGLNLQNRLKADMSNLRTVESARELWKLSQKAREFSRVTDILRRSPQGEVASRLKADDEGRRFWIHAVEPFMRVNGTRGRQEMELTHRRWIDDPSYVFQMIRKYIIDDFAIDDVLERGRRARGQQTASMLATLPASKRVVLETLIKLYSSCSEMRESARMALVTSIWFVRKIVYEVARRLAEEGILRSADEISYVDIEDIKDYLAGVRSASEAFARQKRDAAKKLHQYYLRLPEPPLSLIGEHDPAAYVPNTGPGAELRGVGSSPGKIMAPARVIHDLALQADEFQPGEVLVTSCTDASWTPLFAIASAVVTDVGSILSHSSIVAREFNIPSVVNTKIATISARTGDVLLVDGDTGTVRITRSKGMNDSDQGSREPLEGAQPAVGGVQ